MFSDFYCLKCIFVLLIILLNSDIGVPTCSNDDTSKQKSATFRLKDDLLCNYDRTIRPVINHQNSTRVLIRMILKYFTYSDYESSFSMDSWLAMYWKDDHLKWNPDDYDSLKMIHLSESELWMPDLSVYNRDSRTDNPAVITHATCIVYSSGQVVCVPAVRQSTLCVGDLTHFPFDVQNCTIRMGSWVHTGEEIDLIPAQPPIAVEDLVPNGEWRLEQTAGQKHHGRYKCCPNSTYPSLNYTFRIRRTGGAYTASIILPMATLALLTLTTFQQSLADGTQRFTLAGLNVICHFVFLEGLLWMVPLHNGTNVPLIIYFTRDSLLLTTFALLFTIYLKHQIHVEDSLRCPSKWLIGFVQFVTSYRWMQRVLLGEYSLQALAAMKTTNANDDVSTIIENVESTSPPSAANQHNHLQQYYWFLMAKILDRIFFAVYLIVYISMFFAFTP